MKNTLRDRLQEIIKHSMNSPPARATGMQGTKEIIMGLAVAAGLMFTQTMMAAGPSPVDMKTSAHFTILAASAITGTPACTIIGDVGQTPTTGAAITGLLSSQLNGTIYAVDAGGPAGSVMNPAMLTAAQNDLNTAYFDAAGRLPTPTGLFLDPGAGDIGGMNLAPGLYKFTTTASITAGNVTLTGGPSDVWIFQIGTNLAMTAGLKVVLAGGAQANNIFWQVGTQATIGASADFKGTIMAAQAITVGATTSHTFTDVIAPHTISTTFEIDDPNIAKVAADMAALLDNDIKGFNPDLAHITVALTNPLPSSGSVNASTITWSSGTPAVVSNNGQTINRPTFVSGDATVIFTATLTKGMAIATKPFVLTVLQLSASRIATVTSAIYSVSVAAGAKTISGVPFNTSKVAFLAALVKGEPNQTWNIATIANPVVYGNKLVITAQDGITVVTYTVIVVKAPASSGKAITSFKILGNGTVDEETKTVAVTVPFNTNLTALVPTISVSPLAEINPLSGVVQDFTNPVLYPVTAEDFSIQNYTVTVFKSSSSTLAPVDLGSNVNFVILAGAAVTSTGGGTINGDVGASPIAGSAIGVTDAQVNGIIYAVDASGPAGSVVDPVLLTAAKDYLTIAYNDAAGRTPVPTGSFLNPNGGNIGGLNLVPGLYKFTTTALITGSDVTLTGGPDDVWIFQCAQDLQLGSGIKVILAGGARARNIFWQVGTSAVLGTSSVFKGTIMADQSITMNTSSTMEGRALAFSAEVAFNGDIATLPQDDGGMYLSKMRGSINWAKHAAGISDDRLNISGMINPRGGSSKLTGATAVLRVSGIQLLPAVAMDSNGKASGVINGITYKFKFDWLHGSYSFDIKGLDLRTAIGVPNTTAMILYDLPLRLTIEGAGLDIPLVLGTFECPCSTKIDKASSLTFNSTSNITLTGLYNCNKTQVNQQKQQGGDVFNVKVTGVIEADGGGEVAPTGDITIKIGDATSVIIFAQMTGSGAKWTYKSKTPGITSFIIDNKNHTFTMLASRIAGTNIPLNDPGAPTSYQMQIQLQVPTAVETMIFSSTVEILRKNSTSKTWSR